MINKPFEEMSDEEKAEAIAKAETKPIEDVEIPVSVADTLKGRLLKAAAKQVAKKGFGKVILAEEKGMKSIPKERVGKIQQGDVRGSVLTQLLSNVRRGK